VKDLQRRGVILAVCSKNNIENAREGFSHPDCILRLEDFSAFKANWNPKPANIREIAAELSIGLDSFVFVDDNPAERALVMDQLPEVATPDVGSDVTRFAEILEAEHFFEIHKIVQEDLNRSAYYNSNASRSLYQADFGDYGAFLASLEMNAEIAPFASVYLDRITQLINKTNQFNLTTKRYTTAEVDAISQDPMYMTLYGRLADRFGDNGLVTALIGHVSDEALELEAWLMSCRVLNREMELAMFDALVEQCQARGIEKIVGVYIPSKKNSMVADHYQKLGFIPCEGSTEGRHLWRYAVPRTQLAKSRNIRRAAKPADAIVDRALAPNAKTESAEGEPILAESECVTYR
jgi:FkbH-like protein